MVLVKEIERALKPENYEVTAQEDEILADSVLELANTDFSLAPNDEDLVPGAIRKHVEADMRIAYPGKPTSRKRIFKSSLEANEVTNELDEVKRSSSKSETLSDSDNRSGFESSGEENGHDLNDSELESVELDDNSDLSEEDDEGDLKSDYDGSILGDVSQGSSAEEEARGSHEDETEAEEDEEGSTKIDIFSSRARDIGTDIAKGESIRNQKTIWEKLIECRIKLQPGLINANKLYQKDALKDFKATLDSSEEETIMQTYSALSNLMQGLLELQESILRATPEYREFRAQKRMASSENGQNVDEPPNKKVKGSTDLLKDIDEEFKPFRNSTIEKWNEKTRVSSGKINKNDFSAFDLPTLKQIEEILLDGERLLRRTRTKRSDYSVLGKTEPVLEKIVENNKKKNQGDYDPEIFDDDDFYHKLLRDFIEKKTTDVTDVSKRGRQWLELQNLRSKMKSKVDTRASKGRKLRFTVHNKMINFMAPIPSHTWSDEAKNELFKSLFR